MNCKPKFDPIEENSKRNFSGIGVILAMTALSVLPQMTSDQIRPSTRLIW